MASLKGVNFKEVLINHGEKIGLGVMLLAGLLIVYSARWKVEERTPEELASSITDAEARLNSLSVAR